MIVETTGLHFTQTTSGEISGLVGPQGNISFAYELIKTGVPIGVPSSGTMGDNGALSALTAFDRTYSDGIYLVFGANQIYAGSAAGFYYTVMSSTTAGTVYNNVYDATAGAPTIPSSPTPFVSTGPGAITGIIVDVTAVSVVLPAGALGLNGMCRQSASILTNNTAGTKNATCYYDTSAMYSRIAASTTGYKCSGMFFNAGKTNVQNSFTSVFSAPYGDGNMPTASFAVNSAIDRNVVIAIRHQTATDWIVLTSSLIEVSS